MTEEQCPYCSGRIASNTLQTSAQGRITAYRQSKQRTSSCNTGALCIWQA